MDKSAAAAETASTLTTAIVTGSFTLGGALLGAIFLFLLERLRRSAARHQWLLDRRHESYALLVEQASALTDAADHYRSPGLLRAGQPDPEDHLRELLVRLRSSQWRLALVAPKATVDLAALVVLRGDEFLDAALQDARSPEAFKSHRDAAWLRALSANHDFIDHVTNELQQPVRGWTVRLAASVRAWTARAAGRTELPDAERPNPDA